MMLLLKQRRRRDRGYLINKPLLAAVISEDNDQGLKIVRKTEQLAEKRSLKGNCEVLRTIFQPRALSSDIPASRKGVYFAYFVHLFAFLCVVQVVKFSVTAFGENFVFHDRLKGWLERLHVSWPLLRRSKTRRRIANRTTDIV